MVTVPAAKNAARVVKKRIPRGKKEEEQDNNVSGESQGY
jgi:hypothetical protein